MTDRVCQPSPAELKDAESPSPAVRIEPATQAAFDQRRAGADAQEAGQCHQQHQPLSVLRGEAQQAPRAAAPANSVTPNSYANKHYENDKS